MFSLRLFLPMFFLVCTSGAFGSAIAPSFTSEVKQTCMSPVENEAPTDSVVEAVPNAGMDAIATSSANHVSDGLPSTGLQSASFHDLVIFLTVLESPFPPAVPQECQLKPA